MNVRTRVIIALLLSAALSGGVVQAQPSPSQPGMMMGQPMMDRMPMMDHMGQMPMMNMGSMGMMMSGPMVQGRLAYTKAELGITEAQEAPWKAYADAVTARMASMQGIHHSMTQTMQSGTAPERMDAHLKAMEAMTDALKALKPTTEALYAVLTAEQKQKADMLLGSGCMMM